MANSFERTIRDMRHDSGVSSKARVAVATVLLLGWSVWVCGAHITSYAESHSARLEVNSSQSAAQSKLAVTERSGLRVIAQFQSAALGRIRPGQPATFLLDNPRSGPYKLFPARVTGVAGEVRNGVVPVELELTSVPPALIEPNCSGSVKVETEWTSSASLLLQTAGIVAGAR